LRARCALAAGQLRIARKEAKRLLGEKIDWASGLAQLVRAAIARAEGQSAEMRASLEEAIASFERCAMPLFAAIARMRMGDAAGLEWMEAKGIVKPERIADVIAPGFE
jgi:hypothetical protein